MLYDYRYLLLLIPVLVFSFWASYRVKAVFERYRRQTSLRHITGAEAAEQVLRNNGVSDVRIERVPGNLTDHYDPRRKTIYLSDAVYGSDSVASVGVAAHEAGHAVQYARSYVPIRLRMALVPAANIGQRLAVPLVLFGLMLEAFYRSGSAAGHAVAVAGVVLYAAVALFQFITLPVELDASSRAMRALDEGGILLASELPSVRKTLNAAAMTYVAALTVSLVQLLRLVMLVSGRRRGD